MGTLATSEISITLTFDKENQPGPEVIDQLRAFADVTVRKNQSIISLISNVERSAGVLARAAETLDAEGIKIEMLSQGASKVNISIVIETEDSHRALIALHRSFFEVCNEDNCIAQPGGIAMATPPDQAVPINGAA